MPVLSKIGVNYYHEGMGYITRSNAQITDDLNKIAQVNKRIKVYHNPLVSNVAIIRNIVQMAKAAGFYVVWIENNDSVVLTTTTWNSTYKPAVIADAALAQTDGVDAFIISNELNLHVQGGDALIDPTSNWSNYVAALKVLATSVKANFSGTVGVQELWGNDYKWGNNGGIGTIDKIYFDVYETQAQFKTVLTNFGSYSNLGTVAIGEFSTLSTLSGSPQNGDEESWCTQFANRIAILNALNYVEAYVFTFREPSASGFGMLDAGNDTDYHVAWNALKGGRRSFYGYPNKLPA